MRTKTVNVAFQPNLLSDIDKVARSESRSRSELLREAARMYIERKKRWRRIFAFGKAAAARLKLSEADVSAEIRTYRRDKARAK
ncbi:MAG: ribbon-helix-helix domain-containing protein [Planctomycetota bacterium]